jgi:hypothetical protein
MFLDCYASAMFDDFVADVETGLSSLGSINEDIEMLFKKELSSPIASTTFARPEYKLKLNRKLWLSTTKLPLLHLYFANLYCFNEIANFTHC